MTNLPELTGAEGGVWLVTTSSSTYVMDLTVGTVTRHPGPNSRPTVNDLTRRLRTIDRCRVGEDGYWTMKGGGYTDSVDYYWQSTSVIQRIERIEPAPGTSSRDRAASAGGES